jgi:hypothetical protein
MAANPMDRDLLQEAIEECRNMAASKTKATEEGLPNDIAQALGEVNAYAYIGGMLEGLARRGTTTDTPEYSLMGVPISEVSHVTLDGQHWLEVFGAIYVSALDQQDAFEGPSLTFRVAQAHGKHARFGLEQGATVVTAPHRVLAVVRKPSPRQASL